VPVLRSVLQFHRFAQPELLRLRLEGDEDVARPKKALISKENVIAVATEILESGGIDALALRHLACKLNVNSASLYHHFKNKEEILLAVVRKAFREVVIPELSGDWEVWTAENSVQLRRLLTRKPFLVPLLLQGIRPHTHADDIMDAKLVELGIPEELWPELLYTMQNAVIGSAAISIGIPEDDQEPASRFFDHEELLRNTIRNLLRGMIEQYRERARTDTAAGNMQDIATRSRLRPGIKT
jgi:AcrR family transcriptional regulator